MPANPETQNPTGTKPPKKARRTKPTPVTETATAIASGTERPHRKSPKLPPEVIAAETGQPVKKVRKVRKAFRHGKGQTSTVKASSGTLQQQIDRQLHPTEKSQDIFIDPKTGKPDRFSAHAPAIDKVYRAVVGTDPYKSSATNALHVAEFLGESAAGGAAGKIVGDFAKAKALTRASNAETAAKAAVGARKAVTAEKVAQSSTKTAKTARRAEEAVKGRYAKEARKLRRAKRIEHQAHSINPATGALAATDKGRAAISGVASANVAKSAKTTLSAIPGSFNYAASVGDAAIHAVTTGDLGPLEATGKQGLEGIKALSVYASGDEDKIRQATESQIGYAFLPLAPRGIVSRPAKAAARVVTAPAREAAHALRRDLNPDKPLPTKPGRARKAVQVVTHTKSRKAIARLASRHLQPVARAIDHAIHDVEKHTRKAEGTRGLDNRHGPEAGSAAIVLADYGIKRGPNALRALRERVLPTLERNDSNRVSVQKTIHWLEENPHVLEDDNLWNGVAAIKKRSKEIETSPRAKYLSQARAVEHGSDRILRPEERITPKAEKLSGVRSRTEAWSVYNDAVKAVKKIKAEGRPREAKALLAQVRELHKELDPYTRPEHSIDQTARQPWSPQMVREFKAETIARRGSDFEEPAWVSDRDPSNETALAGTRGTHGKVVHVNTGETARADRVDRSVPAFYRDTVAAPRMMRAINGFIRDFQDRFSKAKTVNGKSTRVFTSKQIQDLINKGKFDPRKEVALPSREWRASLEAADHELEPDLSHFHSEVVDAIRRDMDGLKDEPGTKYTIHDREDALEFADQLNPGADRFESAVSGLNTVTTRAILGTNPAWLQAQFINTAIQAGLAQGPHALARAAVDLDQLRRTDPHAFEDFVTQAGESSASFRQPSSTRISMDHADLVDGARVARKTPLGRILYDAAHLQTLGKIDRSQTAVWRALVLAAHANKEVSPSLLGKMKQAATGDVGDFVKGLGGMMEESERISKTLAGKSRAERLAYITSHPKLFEKHLDYLDDVMGNWDSFTRFEKSFGTAAAFYPYIRMGLRWTFWSYPLRHPVKAQIVYLLAQQENQDLEKFLGHPPSFVESGLALNYSDKPVDKHSVDLGNGVYAVGDQPGARRYGAPGMNSIVESIGSANLNGLTQALNPGLALILNVARGSDPFGAIDQTVAGDLGEQLKQRGLLALQQLLSLSGPVRVLGADSIDSVSADSSFPFVHLNQGEPSVAAKKAAANDPLHDIRSILAPTIGQSAKQARKTSKTSQAYARTDLGVRSELSQWFDLVDRYGLQGAIARQTEALKGKDYLKKLYAGAETPQEKAQVKKIIDAYYALKYPPQTNHASGLSTGGLTGGGLDTSGLK